MSYEVLSKPNTELIVRKVDSSNNTPAYFSDVFGAYGRLTSKPFAFFILVISLLSIVAESNSQTGPFEIIQNTLKAYIADTTKPEVIRSLATFFLGIVDFVIRYKERIFLIFLVVVIPVSYPDKNTFYVVIILLIYICVSSHSKITLIVIIQLVFIYYNLSSSFDRIITIIVLFFISFGTSSIQSMLTSKNAGA